MEFDDLSNRVIGCAIQVHRELGPGLLESTYEQCVAYELLQAEFHLRFSIRYQCHTNKSSLTVVIELTFLFLIG